MSWKILKAKAPDHWPVREVSERDYGIDAYVEVVTLRGEVTGDLCSIQLKGTEKIEWQKDENQQPYRAIFSIEKPTINYWMGLPVAYEKKIKAEIRKKGRQNPEIRRNYFLQDTVEEGNFVSRERLLSCARGNDIIVPQERLFAGIDWARESDYTWLTVVNDQNDVIDWFKNPTVATTAKWN